MDVLDIVKNSKHIYMSESALEILTDYERVLDDLDIYAFKNWNKGELVEGPINKRYWVECTFMWPERLMPDPDGARRLLDYRAKVEYSKDKLTSPVKIESPDDYRPGTRKPNLKEEPVWLVKISIPSELITDFKQGFMELEGQEIDLQDIEDSEQEELDDTNSMEVPDAEEETNV